MYWLDVRTGLDLFIGDRVVESVDEASQLAQVLLVEREPQAMQTQDTRLFCLDGVRLDLCDPAPGDDVLELLVERLDQRGRGPMLHANHQLTVDVANRVEVPIEVLYVLDSITGVVDDGVEVQIIRRDQAPVEERCPAVAIPVTPVGAALIFEHDNWARVRLTCLHQGQRLETLILCAEAPG